MGAVSSIVFAARNVNKCATQHDTTRGAVAVCQGVSSLDSVSKSSVFAGMADKIGTTLQGVDVAVENVFKKAGSESGAQILENLKSSSGATSAVGAVAQKVVNPLLCVSAGVRVLKDDDQYAALIEEASAMGAMFGCESLMKYVRTGVTGGKQAQKGLAGLVTKVMSKASDKNFINKALKKASGWYENLGKLEGGNKKQMLVRVAIDALFVCGSILAYNTGHKIGEALSNRKETSEAADAKPEKESKSDSNDHTIANA